MVLTHAIYDGGVDLEVFTLDTGRLHAETLGMLDAVQARYGRGLTVYRPDTAAVQAHVQAHGAHAFYESVELRKACCQIRKVEPLKRALAGRGAWITGQRRGKAAPRGELPEAEQDPVFGLRSEEHTSELQSLMRISYAVFCLKKKNNTSLNRQETQPTTLSI